MGKDRSKDASYILITLHTWSSLAPNASIITTTTTNNWSRIRAGTQSSFRSTASDHGNMNIYWGISCSEACSNGLGTWIQNKMDSKLRIQYIVTAIFSITWKRISQLSACHLSIYITPAHIAHSAPLIIRTHFNTTTGVACSSLKPDRSNWTT